MVGCNRIASLKSAMALSNSFASRDTRPRCSYAAAMSAPEVLLPLMIRVQAADRTAAVDVVSAQRAASPLWPPDEPNAANIAPVTYRTARILIEQYADQ